MTEIPDMTDDELRAAIHQTLDERRETISDRLTYAAYQSIGAIVDQSDISRKALVGTLKRLQKVS